MVYQLLIIADNSLEVMNCNWAAFIKHFSSLEVLSKHFALQVTSTQHYYTHGHADHDMDVLVKLLDIPPPPRVCISLMKLPGNLTIVTYHV